MSSSGEFYGDPSSQELQGKADGTPVKSGKMEETSLENKNAECLPANQEWHDLVYRIEQEKDPRIVAELAQKLVTMIDEKKLGKVPRSDPK
jgi:hypothetical protein